LKISFYTSAAITGRRFGSMDINTLTNGITLLTSALSALKQAKDLIPDSPKRTEAEEALHRAERQLKLAEAETLRGLGYELCHNHPLPITMQSRDDKNWTCPECGNAKTTGAQAGAVW
jgi:hypothetical protein